MLLTILIFLLVLSVLVLVHELGHYLVAKRLGVKVEEFGFGFPPRLIGKKIGETLYSINLLPIGGFVKLYGEDAAGGGRVQPTRNNQPIRQAQDLQQETKDTKRAFFSRPVWQRGSIVVAGVVMNFLLAVVLLTYIAHVQGLPQLGHDIVIASVAKQSPAEQAGLKSGDIVTAIDGQKITSAEQLVAYTKQHLGQVIRLQLLTVNHKSITINVTPRLHAPANQGAMGIALGENIIYHKYPLLQAPYAGLKEAISETTLIAQGLVTAVAQTVSTHHAPAGLAGPVGIAQLTGEAAQQGVDTVLRLVALLSLNLALLNILPIPALDGGRFFFILIEGVTRRKVPDKFEGYVHAAGMAVLLALIVLITLHDFIRIFSGQPLIPK